MRLETSTDGSADLVEELKQLEAFLPLFDDDDAQEEIQAEIEELEQLIAAAGEPEDEHSMRALTFLQTELARQRVLLDERY